MLWYLLADVPIEGTVKDIAKDAISKTTSELGLMFLLFLMGALILGGLHFWFILRPERKAQREHTAQLTTAVATLCPAMAETLRLSQDTNKDVVTIHRMMQASVRALQKIHDAKDNSHPPNLAAEIGEMRGALGDLEH